MKTKKFSYNRNLIPIKCVLVFRNICKCSHSGLHIVFRNTDGKENYKNQRRIKCQKAITISNNLIGKLPNVQYFNTKLFGLNECEICYVEVYVHNSSCIEVSLKTI